MARISETKVPSLLLLSRGMANPRAGWIPVRRESPMNPNGVVMNSLELRVWVSKSSTKAHSRRTMTALSKKQPNSSFQTQLDRRAKEGRQRERRRGSQIVTHWCLRPEVEACRVWMLTCTYYDS